MVRVAVQEEALGAGVGGNCSSGMDGSKKITRRYPGRGRVYYSGGFRYMFCCCTPPYSVLLFARQNGSSGERGGIIDFFPVDFARKESFCHSVQLLHVLYRHYDIPGTLSTGSEWLNLPT